MLGTRSYETGRIQMIFPQKPLPSPEALPVQKSLPKLQIGSRGGKSTPICGREDRTGESPTSKRWILPRTSSAPSLRGSPPDRRRGMGINGFGRIGRLVFRAASGNPDAEARRRVPPPSLWRMRG